MFLVNTSMTSGVQLIALSLRSAPRSRVSGYVTPFQIQTRIILKRGLSESVNNIVDLDKFKKLKQYENTEDPTLVFIRDLLIPWAVDNGIDTSSRSFRTSAAAVMTILQGMYTNGV